MRGTRDETRGAYACTRRRACRVMAGAAAVMMVAGGLAACGDSSASTTTTGPGAGGGGVTAPDVSLQGCTYTVSGSIPAGAPSGVRPSFAAFSPDPASQTAVRTIAERGGTAMVDGVGVPAGSALYAGPDSSGAPVATVPTGHSVIVAEPVVWTAKFGGTWLAFFIACGGPNLYWASVDQIREHSPAAASTITSLVKELAQAPPYTRSNQASLLPITVKDGHIVWMNPSVKFSVGRGQLIQNL